MPILSYYNTTSVLLCLGITALVCLSVTIFSFQTKVSPGPVGRGGHGGGRSEIHVGLRRGHMRENMGWEGHVGQERARGSEKARESGIHVGLGRGKRGSGDVT